MLHQLQKCNGLFFISKNNNNVIGLMPKWRIIKLDQHHYIEEIREGLAYSKFNKNEDYSIKLYQYWENTVQQNNKPLSAVTKQFTGGLMGFVSYNFNHYQKSALQTSSPPLAIFAEYDVFFSLENESWCLYGPDDDALKPLYQFIKDCLEVDSPSIEFGVTDEFAPAWQYQHYEHAFNRIQYYLKQGDCYQVNLTQPYKAKTNGQLLATLDDLLTLTQAPYAGYFEYQNYEVLSCSPELFIEFKEDGEFVTQPIKGTQPRHPQPEIDQQNKTRLAHSEKDRSENLMIVDLLRNDFSKHAVTGSVKVSKLFAIESFAQVHHMVSEIKAELKSDHSPLDVLFSAFPGGSITGAPKIRAMEIIEELEAEPRGAYCGSMGYLNYDNTGSFNILIRTLQRQNDTITAWAGGGITIASTCAAEYQECSDKIKAILDCVNQYSQSNDEPLID